MIVATVSRHFRWIVFVSGAVTTGVEADMQAAMAVAECAVRDAARRTMNTDQIKALMIEAGRANDWLTVSLCEVALGERGWTTIDGRRYGQRRAIEAVAAIVADAKEVAA